MILKPGEALIREGDSSNELYWLVSGQLEVLKKLQGQYIQVNVINAGELVGEIAFLDQKPRSATVKAVTECQVVKLEYKEFQAMLAAQPKWMKKILLTLVTRLRKMSEI